MEQSAICSNIEKRERREKEAAAVGTGPNGSLVHTRSCGVASATKRCGFHGWVAMFAFVRNDGSLVGAPCCTGKRDDSVSTIHLSAGKSRRAPARGSF